MQHQMMLAEIPLNPSVPIEDEDRVEAQDKKMRRLFFAHHKIGLFVSTIDLAEIGDQYQARLYELRRALIEHDLCIDRLLRDELSKELAERSKKGIHYYHLVPLSKSRFYAERKAKLCLER